MPTAGSRLLEFAQESGQYRGEKHPTSRPLQYSCNCNLLQKAGIIPRLVDDAANDYLAICHLV